MLKVAAGVAVAIMAAGPAISQAIEPIPVAPLPDDLTERSALFYEVPCDVDFECVVFALGCSERNSFEFTVGYSNTEIAEWLTANRDADGNVWAGDASLHTAPGMFSLSPTSMLFGDLNAEWEITMSADAADIWRALAEAVTWSVRLGNTEQTFVVDEAGRREIQKVGKTCSP